MTVRIIRGNAISLPLGDDSVDLIVTSPPYFGLRSYTDQGAHYDGQLGSEASPGEFVDALIAATREMVRVVKPSGSIFVNLGDKYVADNRGSGGDRKRGQAKHAPAGPAGFVGRETARQKSLMGLPWRYALRCIDDLGLILRAEIIWNKPNGLPESVTDRVRRSHEQWFHFTLEPRYYSAVDAIREATTRVGLTWAERVATGARTHSPDNGHMSGGPGMAANPLGKLPGSVWTIPTQPLTVPAELGVDHFAAFPMEWPRRIIRGWSPSGICTVCGQGRRPVVERTTTGQDNSYDPTRGRSTVDVKAWRAMKAANPDVITGESCGCTRCLDLTKNPNGWLRCWLEQGHDGIHAIDPANPGQIPETRPAVVLDPFGGTGTTALVAHALDRHGITVDMSADYCRLAQWRCSDPAQLAAALQVDKPETVSDSQLGFDFEEFAS